MTDPWFTLDGEPTPESVADVKKATATPEGLPRPRWDEGGPAPILVTAETYHAFRTAMASPERFTPTKGRTSAEIEAEIASARPPELALGQHAYPIDDHPGWTREEDRWHGRWVFRRVADGYTFTDSAPTSRDIEEGIACAPPIESP